MYFLSTPLLAGHVALLRAGVPPPDDGGLFSRLHQVQLESILKRYAEPIEREKRYLVQTHSRPAVLDSDGHPLSPLTREDLSRPGKTTHRWAPL